MSEFEFGTRHKWEKVFGPIPVEWSYDRLEEHITRKDQVSEKSVDLPLCSLTIESGVTDKTERYNREFLLNDAESNEYKVVEPGNFVINPMNLRFGAIAQSKKISKVLVSAYYDVFAAGGGLDAAFLEANLKSAQFMYIYDVVATGSLIEKRRVHYSQFKKLALPVPPLHEQQRIAEILSTWDKSIEATERLLENSKKRKKALMQQLLTGKKRLAGFTKDWSSTTLGDLFCERDERNRSDLPLLSISGEHGLQGQEESGRRDTSNDDKSKYLRITIGDIGYNTMRMWQGRCCLADREGIVSPAYTIVVPTSECSSNFMFYLFKLPQTINEFYKYSQGLVSDTWNLKFQQFSRIKVEVPELDEQIRIADLLSEFEADQALVASKLDLLKKEKNALMQQLLTGKKRVKVEETA